MTRGRLALALAAVWARNPGARGSGAASSWYYKSPHACTNSDSPDTQKCRADTESWGCAGGLDTLYCGESEMQTCQEIGREISVASPDGFGFMCPSLMLGTAEMLAAAEADGYHGTYAVVTIDALSCGQCVEIENDDPASFPNAPKITAQVFNSVASSVDVYMAGGGLGANNGCAAVGTYSPMAAMYEKYPTSKNIEFINHLKKAGYPDAEKWLDEVISYAGGLRGGRSYAECMASGENTTTQCQPPGNGCNGMSGVCITDPLAACKSAFVGKSDYVTQKAVESCMYAFEHDLHWNRPVTYQVVPCPTGLTTLTGMIPDIVDESKRGERVKSTTTTMEDCCEPTCSRVSAVEYAREPGSWARGNEVIYTCNFLGQTLLESTSRFSDPCEQADGAEPGRQGGLQPPGGPPQDREGAPSSAPPASTARVGAPSRSSAGMPTQIPAGAPTQSPTSAPTRRPADEPSGPWAPVLRGGPPPRWPRAQGAPASAGAAGATHMAGAPGMAIELPGPGSAGTSPAGAGDQQCPSAYEQCGGEGWSDASCCQGSCVCTAYAESYSQCVPPDGGAVCGGLGQVPGGAVVAIVRKNAAIDDRGARPAAPGGEASAAAPACLALGLAAAGALLALQAVAAVRRAAARPGGGCDGQDAVETAIFLAE